MPISVDSSFRGNDIKGHDFFRDHQNCNLQYHGRPRGPRIRSYSTCGSWIRRGLASGLSRRRIFSSAAAETAVQPEVPLDGFSQMWRKMQDPPPGATGSRVVPDHDSQTILLIAPFHVFPVVPVPSDVSLIDQAVVDQGSGIVDAFAAFRHPPIGQADPRNRFAGRIAEGGAQLENTRWGPPVPLPFLRPPGRKIRMDASSPGEAVSAHNGGNALPCSDP